MIKRNFERCDRRAWLLRVTYFSSVFLDKVVTNRRSLSLKPKRNTYHAPKVECSQSNKNTIIYVVICLEDVGCLLLKCHL